jgi:hypothetical protein
MYCSTKFCFWWMDTVAYIVKLMNWVDEPPRKKQIFLSNSKFGFCVFFPQRLGRMMAHATKLLIVGGDHRTKSFPMEGWQPPPPPKAPLAFLPPPSLPLPKNLFLSPGLNIATKSKSPPCHANLRIPPPPKERKNENCFVSIITNSHTVAHIPKRKRMLINK